MGALDTNIKQTLMGYNDGQLRNYIDVQREFLRDIDKVLKEKEALLRELRTMVDINGNPVPPTPEQLEAIDANYSRILFGNPEATNPSHPDYGIGIVKKMPSLEDPPTVEEFRPISVDRTVERT